MFYILGYNNSFRGLLIEKMAHLSLGLPFYCSSAINFRLMMSLMNCTSVIASVVKLCIDWYIRCLM